MFRVIGVRKMMAEKAVDFCPSKMTIDAPCCQRGFYKQHEHNHNNKQKQNNLYQGKANTDIGIIFIDPYAYACTYVYACAYV